MAFVTTQTGVTVLSGFTPNLMKVTGTYLSSGGGTGGVIAAGYNNSSGTLTAVTGAGAVAIGGRQIVDFQLTPTLSDATAPGGAVSYDTTLDAQKVTIVTTADTGGIYTLWCYDNGA